MGTPDDMTFQARYAPRRLRPGLAVSLVLLAVGVAAALGGVPIGWVLAAFMLWSVANLARRSVRRAPVLTIDTAGVHDHRLPLDVPWTAVASMRTVDRRAGIAKVPLLELVPVEPLPRSRGALTAAVLRGDLAFADARDEDRVMIDLRHLDHTPEEILAAARTTRQGSDR